MAVHSSDSINIPYVSRKGGRIYCSLGDYVDPTIQGLEEYTKEKLIRAGSNSNIKRINLRTNRKTTNNYFRLDDCCD